MTCLLIDGPYLAHRSYHAPYRLVSSKGLDGTMFNSFIRTMNALRKAYTPDRFVVAWESHGTSSWRKAMYKEYKSHVQGRTVVFWNGIKDIQMFLHLLGVEQYYSPENEADDVIATLVHNGISKSLIFTTDKDMMQLVNDNCKLCDVESVIGQDDVMKKYGVKPEQIPDLLAVWGDKADNIEGIKGYGVKKASVLINKYGCTERIPSDDSISKYQNHIKINKKLTTLNSKCHLKPIPSSDFKTKETVESILDKYEFKKMKENLPEIILMGGGIDKWLK